MRNHLAATLLFLAPLAPATAQAHDHVQVGVGIGIHVPGLSIGVNVPAYPELVQVPGQPVYWAPGLDANYFFHDGLYWVFAGDRWYSSAWYDGPWQYVAPEYVPVFVLRVPVGYYRRPPVYFGGWYRDAPPRWGAHWGRGWEHRRAGWDRWDRHAEYRVAPLPAWQRQYVGDRYPRAAEHQRALHAEHERGDDRGRDRREERGEGRGHGGGRDRDERRDEHRGERR